MLRPSLLRAAKNRLLAALLKFVGQEDFAWGFDGDGRGGEQILGGIDVEHSARSDERVKDRGDFGSAFAFGSVVIFST